MSSDDTTVNLDANPDVADWARRRWNIPAHDLETLRAFLTNIHMSVKSFKRSPMYRANVEKLTWLKDL